MRARYLLSCVVVTLCFAYGTQVAAESKMYWTDTAASKIQRANLDGTGVEDLVIGLEVPNGIAVDVAGGKMYWTNASSVVKIQRANLDGSEIEDLVAAEAGVVPRSIVLNVAGGKMYWTEPGFQGRIQRANLDGSGVETLLTAGLNGPQDIALASVLN